MGKINEESTTKESPKKASRLKQFVALVPYLNFIIPFFIASGHSTGPS
jgi:hypothetical protein